MRRRRDTVLKKATWGVAFATAFALAGAPAAQADGSATRALQRTVDAAAFLHPDLRLQALRSPGREVEVIVQFTASTDTSEAAAFARRLGLDVTRNLPIVNALVVRLPASGVLSLAASEAVRAVTPNGSVQSSGVKSDPRKLGTAFPAAVSAASTWGSYTGDKIGVAVIDSGVQGDHADFGKDRVVASVVVNPGATSPRDTVGHGTHVAGIIAGDTSSRGDALGGRYLGVAPQADIVAIKVDDDQGQTTVADVIAGIQFAVTRASDYNIRVINLSLNSDVAQPYDVDPLNAAAEVAWFKGIVVVAAAGNRGNARDAVEYAPANDPYVITVGATDDRGTPSTDDDRIATFSSRGTTQDGFAKPEVTAPGARIVAPLAKGSKFATECPNCVVDGEYLRIGGSSMATAVVSGVVANMLQRTPKWSPDKVKSALVASSGRLAQVDQARAMDVDDAPRVNRGLRPNQALDQEGEPKNGAGWSRSSWSSAPRPLTADWSRSSWSCAQCDGTAETAAEYSRSSWSRSSWSRSSWSSATER